MTAQETTPLELVVSKLEAAGCEPSPLGTGRYQSRCPIHQGPEKSLRIHRFGASGPVLFFCFLGEGEGVPSCTPEAIVAALGLRLEDLKIEPEEEAQEPEGARCPFRNSFLSFD